MEMFGVFIVSKGKCDWVWHVQPQVDLSMIPKLFNLRNFSLEIRCIPSFIVVRNGFTSVAIPCNEIVPFLKQSCNFYLSTFFPIALKLSLLSFSHISFPFFVTVILIPVVLTIKRPRMGKNVRASSQNQWLCIKQH